MVSVPENIYYLTGLDHWGFFACHALVVPVEGRMVQTASKVRAYAKDSVSYTTGGDYISFINEAGAN